MRRALRSLKSHSIVIHTHAGQAVEASLDEQRRTIRRAGGAAAEKTKCHMQAPGNRTDGRTNRAAGVAKKATVGFFFVAESPVGRRRCRYERQRRRDEEVCFVRECLRTEAGAYSVTVEWARKCAHALYNCAGARTYGVSLHLLRSIKAI